MKFFSNSRYKFLENVELEKAEKIIRFRKIRGIKMGDGGLMEPLLKIAAKQAKERAMQSRIENGAKEVEKKVHITAIRNLVKKMNLTVQEAMDVLEISLDKREEYNADLKKIL